jgi:hypothetical protein
MKVRVVALDDYSESFDLSVKPFRARNDQFVFGSFQVRGTYVLQIFGLGIRRITEHTGPACIDISFDAPGISDACNRFDDLIQVTQRFFATRHFKAGNVFRLFQEFHRFVVKPLFSEATLVTTSSKEIATKLENFRDELCIVPISVRMFVLLPGGWTLTTGVILIMELEKIRKKLIRAFPWFSISCWSETSKIPPEVEAVSGLKDAEGAVSLELTPLPNFCLREGSSLLFVPRVQFLIMRKAGSSPRKNTAEVFDFIRKKTAGMIFPQKQKLCIYGDITVSTPRRPPDNADIAFDTDTLRRWTAFLLFELSSENERKLVLRRADEEILSDLVLTKLEA